MQPTYKVASMATVTLLKIAKAGGHPAQLKKKTGHVISQRFLALLA